MLHTFAKQDVLPRLPLPSLDATISAYLDSLKPFINPNDPRFIKHRDAAQHFSRTIGLRLQNRLQDIDNASPHNWLNDSFWANVAYLDSRLPLPINSNWWVCSADDPSIPASFRSSAPPNGTFTPWQLLRAAHFIVRLLKYKKDLDSQQIPPDSTSQGPLCMHQYKCSFGLTRIPKIGRDLLLPVKYPHPSTHCIVLARGHPYKLDLYDSNTEEMRTCRQIEEDLQHIAHSAVNSVSPSFSSSTESHSHSSSSLLSPSVCVLTAGERDQWARTREHLICLSEVNRRTLSAIEESLFVICLDDWTRIVTPSCNEGKSSSSISSIRYHLKQKNSTTADKSKDEQDPTTHMRSHIFNSATGLDGFNRWFDKGLCINIESNSRAGVCGEHSPCEALVPSIAIHHMLSEPINSTPISSSSYSSSSSSSSLDLLPSPSSGKWEKLEWVVDDRILSDIERTKSQVKELVSDSDPMVVWFDEYGTEWIRKVGGLPPDAYIQMALQIAYRKVHAESTTAVYETASTRYFKHGRTDVIRSLTLESNEFVQQVLSSNTTRKSLESSPQTCEKLYTLLTHATKKHNGITKQAVSGHGIDRHLLGLRMVIQTEEERRESDLFFEHELFAQSQDWKLCTSGLHPGTQFWGTGFGAPLNDGYGINYLAAKKMLKFGIESKVSCKETSTSKYADALIESLRDMKTICLNGKSSSSSTQAKL